MTSHDRKLNEYRNAKQKVLAQPFKYPEAASLIEADVATAMGVKPKRKPKEIKAPETDAIGRISVAYVGRTRAEYRAARQEAAVSVLKKHGPMTVNRMSEYITGTWGARNLAVENAVKAGLVRKYKAKSGNVMRDHYRAI